MKFTAAIFALATVAIAAPAELETRTTRASTCSANGGIQACCNGGLLGCLVQVIGSNCNNNAYCCKSGRSTGGLINVDLLNCAKILG